MTVLVALAVEIPKAANKDFARILGIVPIYYFPSSSEEELQLNNDDTLQDYLYF